MVPDLPVYTWVSYLVFLIKREQRIKEQGSHLEHNLSVSPQQVEAAEDGNRT